MLRLLNKSTGPCVQVLLDVGRNGAGAINCVHPQSVEVLPPLTVRGLLSGMPPPPPPPPPAGGTSKHLATRLIHVPASGGGAAAAAWSRGLRLPTYALGTLAPPAAHSSLGPSSSDDARRPVLPTLFVPGFPKSATTWLYTCLTDAFTPRRAGCGPDAALWNASACPRRFLLTTLTATRWQRNEFVLESKKETFYFGGGESRSTRACVCVSRRAGCPDARCNARACCAAW